MVKIFSIHIYTTPRQRCERRRNDRMGREKIGYSKRGYRYSNFMWYNGSIFLNIIKILTKMKHKYNTHKSIQLLYTT